VESSAEQRSRTPWREVIPEHRAQQTGEAEHSSRPAREAWVGDGSKSVFQEEQLQRRGKIGGVTDFPEEQQNNGGWGQGSRYGAEDQARSSCGERRD